MGVVIRPIAVGVGGMKYTHDKSECTHQEFAKHERQTCSLAR
jgi:hypothetical protein